VRSYANKAGSPSVETVVAAIAPKYADVRSVRSLVRRLEEDREFLLPWGIQPYTFALKILEFNEEAARQKKEAEGVIAAVPKEPPVWRVLPQLAVAGNQYGGVMIVEKGHGRTFGRIVPITKDKGARYYQWWANGKKIKISPKKVMELWEKGEKR
jgi:hypothetical protein